MAKKTREYRLSDFLRRRKRAPKPRAKEVPMDAIPVEIVKHSYRPKKADLEADARITKGPVTMEQFEDMARNLVRPVDVTWLDEPRKESDE